MNIFSDSDRERPIENVAYSSAVGGWVVSSYSACLAVIQRPNEFHVVHANYPGAERIRGCRGVQLLDGAAHHSLHHFLMREFAPPRIEVAIPKLRDVCEGIWGEVRSALSTAAYDLATVYADRVAIEALASYVGISPVGDHLLRAYVRWNQALTPWVQTRGQDPGVRAVAERAARRFSEALRSRVRNMDRNDESDFVRRLNAYGRSAFPDWSEDDLVDQFRLLFLAGGEGVAQLLATVCWVLLSTAQNKTQLPGIIEECLRLAPPAQLRPYRAVASTTLDGKQIAAGDYVYLMVTLANTDPELRACPLDFDPDSPVRNHLSFNIGPRFCVGANLSRAVVTVAVAAMSDDLASLQLATIGQHATLQGFRFAGMRPLIVEWRSYASS